MLATILQHKMAQEGLSSRDLADRIGVSHTTVLRTVKGEKIDLDTLKKLCDWAELDLATALNIEQKNDDLISKMALLVEANPRLRQIFSSAMKDVENGKLSVSDFQDIINYAIFRLSQ